VRPQAPDQENWLPTARTARHARSRTTLASLCPAPSTGFIGGTPKIVALAGDPDPGHLWFLVNDGRVMCQHLETGHITDEYRSRLTGPSAVAIRPETSMIAASGAEGIVLFWTNGRQLRAVAGQRSVGDNPWIAPDGSLVAASNGNFAPDPAPYFRVTDEKLRRLDTPSQLQPLDQPEYTSGGPYPYLIQVLDLSTIRLHDPSTLEPTVVLDMPGGEWSVQAGSPDGRNLTFDEWERWGPEGEDYRATCEQWSSLE
jgi:hypothetical protein